MMVCCGQGGSVLLGLGLGWPLQMDTCWQAFAQGPARVSRTEVLADNIFLVVGVSIQEAHNV